MVVVAALALSGCVGNDRFDLSGCEGNPKNPARVAGFWNVQIAGDTANEQS
jgi:hypothetical protein